MERLILGDYEKKETDSYLVLTKLDSEKRIKEAVKTIQQKCTDKTGNQMLQTLLDAPTGLADLYKLSRSCFIEGHHLALVGSAGTSKHEMIQLCTLMNDVVVLEMDVPCYG